jgi:hypothetical protein
MIAILSVVVVLVPIVLGAPPMFVFIPPAMRVAPAIFARFVQFVTRMVRLLAFTAVMLDRFMQMMIRLGDAPLAIIILGAQTRRAGEEQKSRQRRAGQRYFTRCKNFRLKFCLHPILLYV